MKEIALKLHAQGIATIPIADHVSKKPAGKLQWGKLNSDNFDKETIEVIFDRTHEAIAVLGGYVSSGLEILDIDLKNARDPEQLWVDLLTNIGEALPEFAEKCTIVKTPSGGYHIYYLCFEVMGNKKLAYEVEGGKRTCVIETRGDGGYALTYPSKRYEIIQGSIDSLAYPLSPNERNTLHEVCRIFNEVETDTQIEEVKRFVPRGISYIRNPFEDFNYKAEWGLIEGLIRKAGFVNPMRKGNRVFFKRDGSTNTQGGNWHDHKGVFYPFTSNSRLEDGKAYSPATMLRILEFNGDGKACYKYLVQNGYGERIKAEDEGFISKAFESIQDGHKHDQIHDELVKTKADPKKAGKYIEIAKNRIDRMRVFWEESDKGVITIDPLKLKYFLQDEGVKIFKFSTEDSPATLVRCDSERHTIKEIDIAYVKKYLEDYLNDEEMAFPERIRDGVLRKLIEMTGRFFTNPVFEWIHEITEGAGIRILRDTAIYSYVFFRNKIVKISASKPELLSYSDLGNDVYVWEKTIIDHDISLVNMNDTVNLNSCEYFTFIKRLVNLGDQTDSLSIEEIRDKCDGANKLISFITAIGYLMHLHKDRKRAFAVILAEDIEDSNRGGGTGKGIFLKSLSYVRKCVFKPGKSFDPRGEFAFETWKPGTALYLIDDVDRKFDFKGLYNYITDGGEINRKHKSAFELPFEELPKFVLTTNYGDMSAGEDHGERRRKMLLVGKHYGPHFTPFQEFGHNLFDEWDREQWNLFYNFIFECISQYLKSGFVDFPESNNMHVKTFTSIYGIEIFEFFGDLAVREWPFPILLKDIVEEFHNLYKRKDFSSQALSIALKKYCDMFDLELEKTTGSMNHNHNLVQYRILKQNGDVIEENEELPF